MAHTAPKFFQDFKHFIMRGNVIDLAVGVIIGAAFGKITASLVGDIIMPLLGLLIGGVDFTSLNIILTPATAESEAVLLQLGNFILTVVDFVTIAFVIFLFIRLLEKLRRKEEQKKEEAPPAPPKQELLLEEIRDLLKRS